jgi:hypothetical protein
VDIGVVGMGGEFFIDSWRGRRIIRANCDCGRGIREHMDIL